MIAIPHFTHDCIKSVFLFEPMEVKESWVNDLDNENLNFSFGWVEHLLNDSVILDSIFWNWVFYGGSNYCIQTNQILIVK